MDAHCTFPLGHWMLLDGFFSLAYSYVLIVLVPLKLKIIEATALGSCRGGTESEFEN